MAMYGLRHYRVWLKKKKKKELVRKRSIQIKRFGMGSFFIIKNLSFSVCLNNMSKPLMHHEHNIGYLHYINRLGHSL